MAAPAGTPVAVPGGQEPQKAQGGPGTPRDASPSTGQTPVGRQSITPGLPHHEGCIHPNQKAGQNPTLGVFSHLIRETEVKKHKARSSLQVCCPGMGAPSHPQRHSTPCPRLSGSPVLTPGFSQEVQSPAPAPKPAQQSRPGLLQPGSCKSRLEGALASH